MTDEKIPAIVGMAMTSLLGLCLFPQRLVVALASIGINTSTSIDPFINERYS